MSRNDAREKGFFGRHKELEAQLKQCRAEFKILFDNISSGVAVYEARSNGEDFIFTGFNSAAEKIEHLKKEQLIGKSVLEVFPGVTEFGLFAVFQRVWKTGVPEYHPVSTYKDERIAGWRENYVFKLPSGEIIAVYDDVTKHKQSELAVRVSEQCFRAIADYTYDWELWVGPAGRPLWTNPASQRVAGYTPKEILAMSDYPKPIVYEKDRDRMSRAFKAALKSGTGNSVQFRIQRKDGGILWAEISWQPIYGQNGASLGHRESIRDVAERKKAEEALLRAEHEKETIIDCVTEHVVYHDKDMKVLWANRAACTSAGLEREQLIGRHCYEIWGSPEKPCDGCPVTKSIITGKPQEAETIRPDGRIWFIRSSPVRDVQGNITGAVHTSLDITEYKRT